MISSSSFFSELLQGAALAAAPAFSLSPADHHVIALDQLIVGYGIAFPDRIDVDKVRKVLGR